MKCGFWDNDPVKLSFHGSGCSFLVALTLNGRLGTGGDAGHGLEQFEPLPNPEHSALCFPLQTAVSES